MASRVAPRTRRGWGEKNRRLGRAHGALAGLALGDALGMPTQSMPRDAIAERFGPISTLVDAPADQPVAPGLPAGSVTDDTAQALLLARLLIEGGGQVSPDSFAAALRQWEREMVARGSADLLGPSTKAALVALEAGQDSSRSGQLGTTNGAAMRIAPVGIVHGPGVGLWQAVRDVTSVTHGSSLGLAGAYAVAAAVAHGIDSGEPRDAVIAGIAAAHFAGGRGTWVAGADIAARFDALAPLARGLSDQAFASFLYQVVGTSIQSQESVVSAFLLVDRFASQPYEALKMAAGLGGDTDTIGSIAGAILGASHGLQAFPEAELAQVEAVNRLDLQAVAEQLIALRR
ncbi:MAG: ADP-ribosylglycohydrolase family protein [Bifidobacteriaceae bacterium]|jgi:ADP-ribosylglycohydrolase|nr:ADP-ribosylglycohydrolase family protein [Bifidobacteriaceae bacterium]